MPEQRQHKRFMNLMRNDLLSLSICYWHTLINRNGIPSGNQYNSKNIRPCVLT